MMKEKKEKLIEAGAETLAEALLKLSLRSDAADELVDRLIATPEENVQRFKKKITRLKRLRRFIDWREVNSFALELEATLQDLKSAVDDPVTGIELVAEFYKTDSKVFDHCDDSNGSVGDIFRYTAKELFVEYAVKVTDKEKVSVLLLKLLKKDDYGVRDSLIDCAGEYLPVNLMRRLIAKMHQKFRKTANEYEQSHWLRFIMTLARQINDAELYEQTAISYWKELNTSALIDVARVYLESGDAKTALQKIQQKREEDGFRHDERDKLYADIYRALNDKENLANVLYRIFRRNRSVHTLKELLEILGDEKGEEIIESEIKLIFDDRNLSLVDAHFMLSVGKFDEAENYVLARAEQLDGDHYTYLLALAEFFENDKRWLPLSMIYRALLDSILLRGYTKAYSHGVSYLRKLDQIAKQIDKWRQFDSHEKYMELLREKHGRKYSFWSKYE